jgi:hypothetical protein
MRHDFYDRREHDHLRPCEGKNSNICVAEGCYDNACIRLILTPADDDPRAGKEIKSLYYNPSLLEAFMTLFRRNR